MSATEAAVWEMLGDLKGQLERARTALEILHTRFESDSYVTNAEGLAIVCAGLGIDEPTEIEVVSLAPGDRNGVAYMPMGNGGKE